ncbi:hypothetical protein [Chromohalobacter japonicus]|uniref:hypothetical protein n=1 Tax=Chromohalobacter japonicus TaxID=223900 RepID=UPI001FF2B645|nr:hypothetical protein [Chromohalobacter japonicus]MCK0754390.1 hypothetical protein [Chromohalobacter japonicus]
MSDIDFSSLIDVLTAHADSISVKDSRFVVFPAHCDRTALENSLHQAGFHGRFLTVSQGLAFSLSPDNWEEPPPIYQDYQTFWERNEAADEFPREFFVISKGASSHSDEHDAFLRTFEVFLKVRNVAKDISDYYVPADKKALFLVSSGEGVVKKSLVTSLSYEEVLELSLSQEDVRSSSELSSLIYADDVHSSERKEVLRRTITSLLDEPHAGLSDFSWVLKNVSKLHDKYKEQYEIYFHNFSVSKLLNEVDQKTLEFNSKLMDFISNSQNKALTIPGAIVALGALVKSGGGLEIFVVLVGVFIVSQIVVVSNNMMRGTFEDLEWQIEKSFEKFSRIKDSREVVNLAEESASRLYKKIEVAKRNLWKVTLVARMTFWVGLIYAVLVFCGSPSDQNGSVVESHEDVSQYQVESFSLSSKRVVV